MTSWTQAAKNEYKLWVERQERVYRSHFDTDLFHYGNKLGKMMAYLARGRMRLSHRTALKEKGGTISSNPEQVNRILQEFYKTLYSDHTDLSLEEKGRAFSQKVTLPYATNEERDLLNAAISEHEICDTIKRLGVRKAPGPGGFFK